MTYQEWKDVYSPFKELAVLQGRSSAKLFEELKTVYEYYVWTQVDSAEGSYIVPGKKPAIASKYIICENQHEYEEDLKIYLNMNEEVKNANSPVTLKATWGDINREEWKKKIIELIDNIPMNSTIEFNNNKDTSLEMVKEFMILFKQPVADMPEAPAKKRIVFRANLSFEELHERVEASGIETTFMMLIADSYLKRIKKIYGEDSADYKYLSMLFTNVIHTISLSLPDTDIVDLVAVLDGFCDERYVDDGAIQEYGMASIFPKAFAEVQRSNMSKACKTLQEAEETIEYHKAEHGECYYVESKGEYLIFRSSDNKAMKSKYYSPANLRQFIYPNE